MRFNRETGSAVLDPDMTPMIDIVFQLLTFFMLVSSFDQIQADERVKLPLDSMARPEERKVGEQFVINVGYLRDDQGRRIDPDPFVFYAGQRIRVPDFGAKLKQEARIYHQTGIEPEEVTVVIRADAEVPTGLVQELMKQAQEAGGADYGGFRKFKFRARQKAR